MGKPGEAFRGIVIGALYAAAFWALKDTPSHLNLSVGLRLAVLLITSPRRWPTIFAADLLVNLGSAVMAFREHTFISPSYVFLYSLLQPLVIFPGAMLAYQHKLNVVAPTWRDARLLMGAIFVTSMAQPLASVAVWSTYTIPVSASGDSMLGLLARYFCGTFLGGITVIPVIGFAKLAFDAGAPAARDQLLGRKLRAVLREVLRGTPFKLAWGAVRQVDLVPAIKAALFLLSPCVALVIVAKSGIPAPFLLTLRVGLSAIPPILLAGLYGTRGAALGLILANCSVAMTNNSTREPGVVEAQQIAIAFSICAWLAGVFVTRSSERFRRESAEKDLLRKALQRKNRMPDLMRRYKADALDDLAKSLDASQFDRFSELAKAEALSQHFRMLHGARSYLRSKREALFPPLLEEYGLRTALTCAPILESIRQAGEEVGIYMPSSVRGIAIGTQQTVYQIVHECLTHAMREGTVRSIKIKVRVGSSNGRQWLALRMRICARPVDEGQSKVRTVDRASMDGLYDLAEAYGGQLRQSRDDCWRYVSALLFDEEAEALLLLDSQRA